MIDQMTAMYFGVMLIAIWFFGFIVGRGVKNDYHDYLIRRNRDLAEENERLNAMYEPDWWKLN